MGHLTEIANSLQADLGCAYASSLMRPLVVVQGASASEGRVHGPPDRDSQ